MAFTIWIEGVDKTSLLRAGSLSMSFRTNYDNNLSMDMVTTAAGYIPDVGQDIQVKDGSTTIWGGVIKDMSFDKLESGKGNTKHIQINVSSDGYRSIASRRTVALTYDQKSAAYVVTQIAGVLAGEGVTVGTINAGADPVGENGEYDAICKSCAEVLDDMANASGFMWYIDEGKALRFFNHDIIFSAPQDLVESEAFDDYVIEEYSVGLDPYANKVFLRGGVGDDGFPVQAIAEDSTEQAARAASEGGTGVYGTVVNDGNISTLTDAQAAADEALQRNGIIPRTLVFTTSGLDWWPGGRMKANLPTFGLSTDTYFLVEDVEIYDVDGINLRSRIHAVSRKAGDDFTAKGNQTGIEYLSKALSASGGSGGNGNGSEISASDGAGGRNRVFVNATGALKSGGTASLQIRNIGHLDVGDTLPASLQDGDIVYQGFSASDKKEINAATTLYVQVDGLPQPTFIRYTGTTYSVALPTDAGLSDGVTMTHKNMASGTVTLTGTVDGVANYALTTGSFCTLRYNGTDWDRIG